MKMMFLFCLFTIAFSAITETLDCGAEANKITCNYDSETLTLTISGEGELNSSLPWKTMTCRTSLTKINITATITSLPDGSFQPGTDRWGHANSDFSQLTTVELPSTLKSIGKNAFKQLTKLNSVKIPSTAVVTSIGESAFEGCSAINYCQIKGVETIGNKAFYTAQKLVAFDLSTAKTIGDEAFYGSGIKNIDFGNGLTSIGNSAFRNCGSLQSVLLVNGIVNATIGNYSFYECASLSSFSVKGIKTVGNNAFYNTPLLPSFDFSAVTSLGEWAFQSSGINNITFGKDLVTLPLNSFDSCKNLTSIEVDGANQIFSSTDGVLYQIINGQKTLILYPSAKNAQEFVVANDTKAIVTHAFSENVYLKKVNIGANVTSIVKETFYNCRSLQTVVLGRNLEKLAIDSFSGCPISSYEVDECNEMFEAKDGVLYTKSIGNVALIKYPQYKTIPSVYEIPKGVNVIYNRAFTGLTSLEEITIGNDVYSIHSYAFTECSGLKKVTLSGNITSIGSNVFSNLNSLTTAVIGDNVKMLGNAMFDGCGKLENVTISENSQLLTIERYVFQMTKLKSFVIPNKVQYVMEAAFSGITTLENITIGKNVIAIGLQTFSGCGALKNVIFKTEKLLSIDQYAFETCTSLQTIEIPTTVEIVSLGAFSECSALKTVSFKGTEQPAYCSENAFEGLSSVTVNVESTYTQLQFCGINVSKKTQ